jgi:hypothetical protein
VLSIAVSQTSRRPTRQINLRYFISAGVYFSGQKYPLKSPAVAGLARLNTFCLCARS